MLNRLFLTAMAALALAGCKVPSDVGVTCTMLGRDGGPIREVDIKQGANKDFIAFGSTGCEDLVCVRDSQFRRPDSDGGAVDPNLAAVGYCSRPCVVPDELCPSADPADDLSLTRKITCRALLLDKDTLDQICKNSPEKCIGDLGNTKSPLFCVRKGVPVNPDGGT